MPPHGVTRDRLSGLVELGKGPQHRRELLFHVARHVVVGGEGRLRRV